MRDGTKAVDPFADGIRININDVRGEVGYYFLEVRMPLHYITIHQKVQERSGQNGVAYVAVPLQLTRLKGLGFQINLAVY